MSSIYLAKRLCTCSLVYMTYIFFIMWDIGQYTKFYCTSVWSIASAEGEGNTLRMSAIKSPYICIYHENLLLAATRASFALYNLHVCE